MTTLPDRAPGFKNSWVLKTVKNALNTITYNQLLLEDPKINKELNKSTFRIMAISLDNFKEFYKNKDMSGYYTFFINNYLENN